MADHHAPSSAGSERRSLWAELVCRDHLPKCLPAAVRGALPGHRPGALLHTIYQRPDGWDHVPEGRRIPCGESCQWGNYHALELALLIRRLAAGTTLPWRSA